MTQATGIVFSAIIAAMAASAHADGWRDDFNDGSATDGVPVSWELYRDAPSDMRVVGGDLILAPSPLSERPHVMRASVPVTFDAGASVRARLVALDDPADPNGMTAVAVSLADGLAGYVARFSTCGGGVIDLFRIDGSFEITTLDKIDWC